MRESCLCETETGIKPGHVSREDKMDRKPNQTTPTNHTHSQTFFVWVWLLSHASAHGVVMDDEIENGFTDAVEEDESDPVVHEVSLLSAYWPLLCPFLLFF